MSSVNNHSVHGIGYQLKRAQHALRMRMDDGLRPLGLTTPQYAVLSQLESRPGISNAALARASFVTAQSMHGIVSNLERSGLVARQPDPLHGRILCAELTPKGVGAVAQAHQLIAEVERSMMCSFNVKESSQFKKMLIECIHNLH